MKNQTNNSCNSCKRLLKRKNVGRPRITDFRHTKESNCYSAAVDELFKVGDDGCKRCLAIKELIIYRIWGELGM